MSIGEAQVIADERPRNFTHTKDKFVQVLDNELDHDKVKLVTRK